MLLQVVALSRDVGDDCSPGAKLDLGDLSHGRVGLLGLDSIHCPRTVSALPSRRRPSRFKTHLSNRPPFSGSTPRAPECVVDGEWVFGPRG